MIRCCLVALVFSMGSSWAFQPKVLVRTNPSSTTSTYTTQLYAASTTSSENSLSRRDWISKGALVTAGAVTGISIRSNGGPTLQVVEPANAVGPVKINLLNPTYRARPCPKDKPIPGEKAMKGMKVRSFTNRQTNNCLFVRMSSLMFLRINSTTTNKQQR
jgi:hypothetical protein